MNRRSRSQMRSVQVFGISLTEMMLILLFFMFLIAKNAVDTQNAYTTFNASCAAQLAECKEKLAARENEVAALTSESAKLRRWVQTLLSALNLKPLPADDPRFVADAEAKIAKVGGGPGKPSCLPDNRFVLEATMTDGYFAVRRIWDPRDDSVVQSVPAISAMVAAGRMSFADFRGHAARIATTKPECAFSLKVVDRTTTKESFKSQLLFLERYFRRRVE